MKESNATKRQNGRNPGVEPSTFVDTKVVKSVGGRLFYSPNVHLLNHFD